MKELAVKLFKDTQDTICNTLEYLDSKAQFGRDNWTREDVGGGHGGGGLTRVLRDGKVFEQGGVNFSEVHGTLPASMSERLTGEARPLEFFASGVSLVIHPLSPMIPTTHANFRYLEVGDKQWFGGGADLTPYYLFEEDAVHFHQALKSRLDLHGEELYPKFKEECDRYFFLKHRNECRGIGGVFYDYLGKEDPENLKKYYSLSVDTTQSFLEAYVPIVEKRISEPYGDKERQFQLLRRGRYVEFNLIYDRGTTFGLQTGGRTESILMSLPPIVRWEYCFSPEEGSREADLIDVLSNPRDWLRI